MHGARRPAFLLLMGALAAQEPTCRLEGSVIDPQARGVPNAAIAIEREGTVIPQTRSDGQGRFVVGRVTQVTVTVRATAEGPYVGGTKVDLGLQPQAFVSVRLMPARKLSGRVLDAEGAAVAGAWVATTPTGDGEFGVLGTATRSDAEGRFVFEHVPFGRNALRVWRPSTYGFAADIDGAGDVELECRLEADDPQERNFELQDATPAQRSTAVLTMTAFAEGSHMPLPPELRRPPLDDTKRWRVHGWPFADAMRARLSIPGACSDPDEVSVPADLPDRTKFFSVEPAEAAVVRGILVATGCELPKGGVPLAIRSSHEHEREEPWILGRADGDGSFVLPSPVARDRGFCLRCLDERFALQVEVTNPLLAPPLWYSYGAKHKAGQEHRPVLRPACKVRCDVRNPDGTPFAGATVMLLAPERGLMRFANGKGVQGAALYATDHSNRDGTCELLGLGVPDGRELVCQISGPGGFLKHRFAVSAEPMQDLGVLTVGPAVTLRGLVVSADGRAMPGARVRVDNWSGSERTYLLAADRDGTFVVAGLMPGQCDVLVVGNRASMQSLSLEAGATVDVTLK
ncbi:MAG: carboxypeptidase-like regulatory domain-containing protein [Planctomycetota bacterium]